MGGGVSFSIDKMALLYRGSLKSKLYSHLLGQIGQPCR